MPAAAIPGLWKCLFEAAQVRLEHEMVITASLDFPPTVDIAP